jgi:hypothetical protein
MVSLPCSPFAPTPLVAVWVVEPRTVIQTALEMSCSYATLEPVPGLSDEGTVVARRHLRRLLRLLPLKRACAQQWLVNERSVRSHARPHGLRYIGGECCVSRGVDSTGPWPHHTQCSLHFLLARFCSRDATLSNEYYTASKSATCAACSDVGLVGFPKCEYSQIARDRHRATLSTPQPTT